MIFIQVRQSGSVTAYNILKHCERIWASYQAQQAATLVRVSPKQAHIITHKHTPVHMNTHLTEKQTSPSVFEKRKKKLF